MKEFVGNWIFCRESGDKRTLYCRDESFIDSSEVAAGGRDEVPSDGGKLVLDGVASNLAPCQLLELFGSGLNVGSIVANDVRW